METEVPNLYTDSVSLQLSPFGALLVLMVGEPASGEGPTQGVTHTKVANVRMSLEHAKVLAIMLNRQLHAFENDELKAQIPVHPQIVGKLKINLLEEWR